MKIRFLIADEFRFEATKKITALGLYPDEVIIYTPSPRTEGVPEDAPVGLERLAFMFIISELEGVHNYKGLILDTNHAPMSQEYILGQDIKIETGMSHTLTFEAKPFVFKNAGIYTFVLYVDDVASEHKFEFRLAKS